MLALCVSVAPTLWLSTNVRKTRFKPPTTRCTLPSSALATWETEPCLQRRDAANYTGSRTSSRRKNERHNTKPGEKLWMGSELALAQTGPTGAFAHFPPTVVAGAPPHKRTLNNSNNNCTTRQAVPLSVFCRCTTKLGDTFFLFTWLGDSNPLPLVSPFSSVLWCREWKQRPFGSPVRT